MHHHEEHAGQKRAAGNQLAFADLRAEETKLRIILRAKEFRTAHFPL